MERAKARVPQKDSHSLSSAAAPTGATLAASACLAGNARVAATLAGAALAWGNLAGDALATSERLGLSPPFTATAALVGRIGAAVAVLP